MQLSHLLAEFTLMLGLAWSFDISKPPFQQLKLDVPKIVSFSTEKNTPPSKITSNWSVLMKDGDGDKTELGNGCPGDSTLCGIITADDSKTPIQLFSVSEANVQFAAGTDTQPITASWQSVAYGDYTIDVTLDFLCNNSTDPDSIEWVDPTLLIEGNLHFSWKNGQFCASNGGPGDADRGRNTDSDGGLGFFGSVLILMAVAFAGYIVAQAWLNTSTMGSSGDFFNELADSVVENLHSIPRLVVEVVNKITGNGSSNRGGYSAV